MGFYRICPNRRPFKCDIMMLSTALNGLKVGARVRPARGESAVFRSIEAGKMEAKRSDLSFKYRRASKLSESGRARSNATKKSLVEFAKKYGRSDQVTTIQNIPAYRLDAMERAGIIDFNVFFDYKDLFYSEGSAKDAGAEQRLDAIIQAYNEIVARDKQR